MRVGRVPDLGFRGEVAGFYHEYRHGYPETVIDRLTDWFGLDRESVVVDLGCGTGQLTLPIARRVRAVLAVDPEVDMLRRARKAADDAGLENIGWMLGRDTDIGVVGRLFGERSVGAVTVGQALHWMNWEDLFGRIDVLVRAGGGIAIATNGTPLWLHDTDWSRRLRLFLERWLGTTLTAACGTDRESQERYRRALDARGFEVLSDALDYEVELDLEQLIGGLYSAMGTNLPTEPERPRFAARVREAVAPDEHFREKVHVALLAGRIRPAGAPPVGTHAG